MRNPDFNEILKGNTSRYSLVSAVAKRAREISADETMVEIIGDEKPVSYALEELIEGTIEIVEPDSIKNI